MKIAAAQLTCVPADVPANVARATALAVRAREEGAGLLVLPELVLTGYELRAVAEDPSLWVTPEDPRLDPLRSSGIATVVNCAAPGPGGRPVIASLVFGPAGVLLTTYAKQHLYEQERDHFSAGDRDGRFELGGLRFCLATCFDNHVPELAARGAADGCRVHLASSLYGTGNGVRERAALHPALARDHGLYVALANHVGPAGPWTGCGGAAVWAPDGTLLAEADDRAPGLAVAEVPGAVAEVPGPVAEAPVTGPGAVAGR
ncbi:carbon-nitrogen hydrolase family protein [Streptomyces sp. WAC06614]|uniref:carbon-nitrogen hydrolase family protein n=1 Tax=Streptomyces sp. WAC06614 TaxID=2487416 RepID=UPI000F7B3E2D|nr:carbon-nitrogen hydrolase family protein [Streptomyces sp. WAC06614]RSS68670.1 carbon-nitrogen hydrolase family protein [Streptomyces sp. WAC06614]